MFSKKAIFQIFCLGMILLQMNTLFLKDIESREKAGILTSKGFDQDSCAAGSIEVSETGEAVGTGAEAKEATDEEMGAEEDTKEKLQAGKSDNTTEADQGKTQGRKALRKTDRKTGRKATRKAARLAGRKTLRQSGKEADACEIQATEEKPATVKLTAADPAEKTTEDQIPSNKTSVEITVATNNFEDTKQKADKILEDIIGSIKDTQKITVEKVDALKDSDIFNVPGKRGEEAKKEAKIEQPKEEPKTEQPEISAATNATNATAATTEEPAAEEETTEEPATGAATNATEATNATLRGSAGPKKVLKAATQKLRGEADSEIVQDTCDGPRMNRPMCPCRLKRKYARKLRRSQARDSSLIELNSNSQQWDVIKGMKESAPTLANAISEACTVAKARASDNSTSQSLADTNSSQNAQATGKGDSISVANSIGKTISLTDTKTNNNSNAVGVSQATTNGKATSNADTGSVSIANNKDTNCNSNKLNAEDNSVALGRVNSISGGESTATATEKSLAASNTIDNSIAKSNLKAKDNSTTVGNTVVASNAKAASTSDNGSRAQTVSESLGEGNTDLCAAKNSRAVGNLELKSGSDATAKAENGGNTIATANSKSKGANEGAADNNSTVLLNNKNENNSTASSTSEGTLAAATKRGGEATKNETGAEAETEQATAPLKAGKKPTLKAPATNETEAETGAEAEAPEEAEIDSTEVGAGLEGNATATSIDVGAEGEETAAETKKADICDFGSETKKADICDFSTETTKLKSKAPTLAKGIFKGDAHLKNICRHKCEDLSLPRVTRAEIKAGSDGLTIFRCLCGTQYTSWYKPNYGTADAGCTADSKTLTRRAQRKQERAARRSQRKALRQSRREKTTDICEDSTTSEGLKGGKIAVKAILRRGEDKETGCDVVLTKAAPVAPVDLQPVVNDFIDNNANSIKAQDAKYLNQIEGLLASKTGGAKLTAEKKDIC